MTQVAFYRLNRKIVNNEQAIPEDAQQVMYYSLAIGHHVGVMDCFSELMAVPEPRFMECVRRLPEGDARRKLEGATKWQEIEINRSHVDELLPALGVILPQLDAVNAEWVRKLVRCLQEIVVEPALYIMVKTRE